MITICLFLFSIVIITVQAEATVCENGWIHYKDGICLKFVGAFLTFDEAKTYCSAQHNSTLVMLKDSDIQLYLTSTTKISGNVWLGAEYDLEQDAFQWDDGTPVSYMDWEVGSPNFGSESDYCIQLNPLDESMSLNNRGKWATVNCSTKNLVICQRTLLWSVINLVNEVGALTKSLQMANELIQQMQQTIAKADNNLRETQLALQASRQDLDTSNRQLQTMRSQIIPVGYIYFEYPWQYCPRTLWPTMTWSDVTSSYAGVFFRAGGGAAGGWGSIQNECVPRITRMGYNIDYKNRFLINMTISHSGWSEYVNTGRHYYGASNDIDYEGIRVYAEYCEVRPRNMAVRIWKRIA